jgi:alpha-tubulin suppressor-like RCC1 family protein
VPQVMSEPQWATVSTGAGAACGIRRDGTLWCWGNNRYGELGDGTQQGREAPVQSAGGGNWRLVSLNSNHGCAVRSDDSLWCWGNNEAGQLGDGTTTDSTRPVRVMGEAKWSQVTTSGLFTCGTRRDGALWCWGYGPLGDDNRWPEPRRLDGTEAPVKEVR